MPDNENNENSMEDLMREETNRLSDFLVPICWSSSSQDLYVHWDPEEERDVLFPEKQQKRFLKSKGLRGVKLPSEIMSPVEAHITRSDREYQVDYIGKIGCLPHGFCEVDGQRFYNTERKESSEEIESRSIAPIEETLRMFLGGPEHDQYFLVKRILAYHWMCMEDLMREETNRLRANPFRVPRILILVGNSADEARTFAILFTRLLGGEAIDPTPYLKSLSSAHSAVLARAMHWSIRCLPENPRRLLHTLFHIKKLSYGKSDEVTLPFISQRTIFVQNTARGLKELPSLSVLRGFANVIYLHPLNGYQCRFGAADFAHFGECVSREELARHVPDGYIAPEIAQSLFHASLAGEAYHVLHRNIPSGGPPLAETELLTHLENSSRHFQNRMNREKETVRTLLETISQQYPLEVSRVSETHWNLNLPPIQHDNE